MTTYMEIVNKVIVRTNEVQVDELNFASVIGVQKAIKDSIIDSLDKIIQKKYKWPFLAETGIRIVTPGIQEYAWPSDFLSVDWNSFYIAKSVPLNVGANKLQAIEREEWYRIWREDDLNSAPDGLRMPHSVFSNHGNGFGVTPCPERAYTINFRYFKNPDRPVAWDDVLPIPQEYEYLLIQGGLMHMYTFYDNSERAALAEKRFDDGLKDMVMTLIGNNLEHVYAGQVNF